MADVMAPPNVAPPGGPPAGAPPGIAGPTGPATLAPDDKGRRARGLAMGNLALNVLTKALQFLGPQTEEGQAVADAIAKLGKRFTSASGDIERQEVKMLGAQAGPMNQPTPQQGEAWRQMIADRLKSSLPGAAA